MKTILSILFVLTIFVMAFALGVNPKQVVCNKACDATNEGCKEKAKEDAKKIAACAVADIACREACEQL